MRLQELASYTGGEVVGDGDIEIHDVMKIEEAADGTIAFLANPKYAKFLEQTKASAVIIQRSLDVAGINRVKQFSGLFNPKFGRLALGDAVFDAADGGEGV